MREVLGKFIGIVLAIAAIAFLISIIPYYNEQITGFSIYGACSGEVHDCTTHNFDEIGCISGGCVYLDNKCQQTHDSCSTYFNQTGCEKHFCIWTPSD